MRHRFQAFVLLAAVTGAAPAAAGPTERACLSSARSPGPAVCACSQALANQFLTPRDQERAARIIQDPDHFHEIESQRGRAAQDFMARYRAWGEAAEQFCTG
ncbi:hypothetical protein HMH01_05815 [Halovulum dunhuangense]|uniref:Secreted protein n=1 Tax=Halovulum dunhuangense TaxID=1505036 RepID=A0A849L0Z8_9RHOB|nr:hypothetical protein [Halovulum dunhuangense]NNU79952.1 hypothetical protein [Halovulum dunhuangense]